MRKLLIMLVLLLLATPVFAQTATPAPTPTATPFLSIPSGELSQNAGDASSQINSIGGSLTAPTGINIIPNVDWGAIFGYLKWLIAPPTGDELAGPFGPAMVAIGALLTTEITFLSIKGVVFLASYILSWIFWIFKLILAILQVLVAIVSAIVSGPIGAILGFLGL